MKFVTGTALYRCHHCRQVPAVPKHTRPISDWPLRVAQLAAGAAIGWGVVNTTQDTTHLQQLQRDHVADLREQLERNEADLHRRELDQLDDLHQHQIPYPPVGATGPEPSAADSLPLPNGSHYHCEQETFVTGISLPTAMGTSCSFRWPDGSLAPPPPPPLKEPTPMTLPG